MLIQAPVYIDQSGTHFINMYEETEDGTFRRTQSEPLRQLRNNIKGISRTQGELVSNFYDRQERAWQTATVTFHYGRPQSFFYFLRSMIAKNRFFVFSKPQLSGHLSKFDLHELILKPSTSQRHLSLLKEKYVEATILWSEEELAQKQLAVKRVAAKAALNRQDRQGNGLDVDFEHAKTVIIPPDKKQSFGLPFGLNRNAPELATNKPTVKRLGDVDVHKAEERSGLFPNRKNEKQTHFLQRFLFTID